MKRLILIWGLVLGSILAASLYYLWSAGSTPEGQPGLVSLDAKGMSKLRSEFNRDPAQVRMIAILSPTDPANLEAASALQQLMMEFERSPLQLQIIWQPMVQSDWAPPSTESMARIWDIRARQYWDKAHAATGPLQGAQLWVFSRGATWQDSLPPAGFRCASVKSSLIELRAFLRQRFQSVHPAATGSGSHAI